MAAAGAMATTTTLPARAAGTEEHRALMVAAQLMRHDAKLLRARELLVECSDQTCDAGADAECDAIRAYCKKAADETAREIPALEVHAVDDRGFALPSASVRIGTTVVGRDGRLALDPGHYTVRAEYLGRVGSTEVDVARTPGARTTARVVIDLRRTVTFRPTPVPVWILAGAATVSVIVGGALTLSAQSQASGFDECRPTCDLSKRDDFERTVLGANIALVSGVAFALGAGAWFLARPSRERVEHVGAGSEDLR